MIQQNNTPEIDILSIMSKNDSKTKNSEFINHKDNKIDIPPAYKPYINDLGDDYEHGDNVEW